MSGSAEETRARLLAAIERERKARGLDEEPERGADLHALAWGHVAQALERGRRPSADDLLSGIAGDPAIPEIVRNYASDLVRGATKPTAGRKPEWNLNHRAWQTTRDLLLIEKVHERRSKMPNGAATPLREVFIDIEARKWSPAKI
jgi:hypothetical protein